MSSNFLFIYILMQDCRYIHLIWSFSTSHPTVALVDTSILFILPVANADVPSTVLLWVDLLLTVHACKTIWDDVWWDMADEKGIPPIPSISVSLPWATKYGQKATWLLMGWSGEWGRGRGLGLELGRSRSLWEFLLSTEHPYCYMNFYEVCSPFTSATRPNYCL